MSKSIEMKRTGIIGLLLLALLAGPEAFAQRKPKIKGNRQVTEVAQSLPPFKYIRLTDDLEVTLQRREAEGYLLEADDNLVDVLRLEVMDSTLHISSFYNVTRKKALNITVYFSELASAEVTAGRLISEDVIAVDLFTLRLSEAAKARMRLRADVMTLHMENNSSADLNVEADSLSVQMLDRTDATLYTVNQDMGVSLQDNASLTLEGITEIMEATVTRNAGLKASKMEADRVKAHLDAAGTARLRALTEVELDASGQSRTYIYGEPEIRLTGFRDRSELHKELD